MSTSILVMSSQGPWRKSALPSRNSKRGIMSCLLLLFLGQIASFYTRLKGLISLTALSVSIARTDTLQDVQTVLSSAPSRLTEHKPIMYMLPLTIFETLS